MASPLLGSITIFAGTFAPRNYAFCNGGTLPVRQYPGLYGILGTFYGGDGVNTFGLPDLRNRVPIQQGQGPGLSSYLLGNVVGESSHALTLSEMPSHNHGVQAATATTGTPGAQFFLGDGTNLASYTASTANEPMATGIGPAGFSVAHPNLQPSLYLNYIIALVGLYPSRQ